MLTPSLEGQDCHFVENDYLGLKCLKRNFNAKKITLLILNEWSRFDHEMIKWPRLKTTKNVFQTNKF